MFYYLLGFLIVIYIYYGLEVYIQENKFKKNKEKMSTRAQIRFATREEGVSFNEHPEKIHAQFYKHHDGYPEGLGVEIAESLVNSGSDYGVRSWEIESLTHKHGDLEYVYYIWQAPEKETWISIFEGFGYGQDFECIFVGKPQKLLNKYKPNTND